MSLLLVHDQLLSKKGIAAPVNHFLAISITKYKARLSSEFTRLRLRAGYATLEAYRNYINSRVETPDGTDNENSTQRIRWVRVNTLLSNVKDQLSSTFARIQVETAPAEPSEHLRTGSISDDVIHVDYHVPDLLAIPRSVELTRSSAYQKGHLILQDKASCFPALLLDVAAFTGDIIDACAAPGNKTTQIAALIRKHDTTGTTKRKIWAMERDQKRAETLRKMVNLAGAPDSVSIQAGQDFLLLDAQNEKWQGVGGLLLDPSCTGSGMLNRQDKFNLVQPRRKASARSKSSKRATTASEASTISADRPTTSASHLEQEKDQLSKRIQALSHLQLKMLRHAFRFPSANRVVYSTCSVFVEENEHVVIAALSAPEAKANGWRILKRQEQVPRLSKWEMRGDRNVVASLMEDHASAQDVAEACIRCPKGGVQATIGFFVAGFVRETSTPLMAASLRSPTHEQARQGEVQEVQEFEEEWNGFSDTE